MRYAPALFAPPTRHGFLLQRRVGSAASGFHAWFDVAVERTIGYHPWCFGLGRRWGLIHPRKVIGLIQAAVWGEELTAVRLASDRPSRTVTPGGV